MSDDTNPHEGGSYEIRDDQRVKVEETSMPKPGTPEPVTEQPATRRRTKE